MLGLFPCCGEEVRKDFNFSKPRKEASSVCLGELQPFSVDLGDTVDSNIPEKPKERERPWLPTFSDNKDKDSGEKRWGFGYRL